MNAVAPPAGDTRPGPAAAGTAPAAGPQEPAPRRWLVFHLCAQRYALPVSDLREALAWQAPTPVPCAPAGVLGLIHRRGAILSVVDIRRPLGLGDDAPAPHGALVLIGEALALAVDGIGEIFVPSVDRQRLPHTGPASNVVQALVTRGTETVVLLDAEALAAAAAGGEGTPLARAAGSQGIHA
ncbi:MAG TPA: chemotaxis protein CheW [Burkholderiaceae bacterium]